MKNKSIAIVTPSYNEAKNISIILKKIKKYLPESKIVIVDDSNIKENRLIRNIINKYKNVILISRFKKMGRGSAIVTGFKEILKDKKIDYVFEMDSDLAHDPKEFKRFIKEVNVFPYDLIIGSRYKSGGRIINIAKNRTIMSRLINNFLFFWLGVKISDFTSGFRLYSRKSVEFIVKAKLKSKGFITLSEIAYKLHRNNYSVSEVPITWNYRKYGKSNVNSKELINSLYFVILMRVEDFFKSLV